MATSSLSEEVYDKKMRMLFAMLLSVLICKSCFFEPVDAASPTLSTLYEFSADNDGAMPVGSIVLGAGGVFYGVTTEGGAFTATCSGHGCGTVYSMTPPLSPGGQWTERVLWSFGGAGDGSQPNASPTIGPGSILYGTTTYGGASGNGTVYSMTPPSSPGGQWTERVLWSFGAAGDGSQPNGRAAIGPGGILYGTTTYGGASGSGIIFSLSPPAVAGGPWVENILWNFAGGKLDGSNPWAGVIVDDVGVLYGTTQRGGTDDRGVVFALTSPAQAGAQWTEAILHSFGSNGGGPIVPLAIRHGLIYGATNYTSHSGGTVFSLAPPNVSGGPWVPKVLFTFPIKQRNAPDGQLVNGPLVFRSDGSIIGTAASGGTARDGVVFRLRPPVEKGKPWTETSLYNFNEAGNSPAAPMAGLVRAGAGIFYGTASFGGASGRGVVFSFAP